MPTFVPSAASRWIPISIALASACNSAQPAADEDGTGSTGGAPITTFTGAESPGDGTGVDDSGTTSGGATSSESTSSASATITTTDASSDSGGESTGGDPVDPYGDCVNHPAARTCDGDASCFVDDRDEPTVGVCLQGCAAHSDCPPSVLGDPPTECTDVDDDGTKECVLSCSSGTGCPPYMQCFDETLCVWPRHGFSACEDDPSACLSGEECVLFDAPPFSVCAGTSCGGDPSLCPPPPPGGSANVTCGFDFNSDSVSDCMLDCSGGASCPAGMSCQAGALCVWLSGGLLPCADVDLGTAMGSAVAIGTTFGAGDQLQAQCTGGNADEVAFAWTAPANGFYLITTENSDYDTVLYVHEDCAGSEIACNDDSAFVTSEVVVVLDAGQTVLIVVDGFGQHGNYVLNIY